MATKPHTHATVAVDRPVTLVDSSVILDVLTGDSTWIEWSESTLIQARDEGQLVINPIVYAEVSTGFDRIEDLDDALPADDFEREPLPYEAGFVAGKAFLIYRKRGGQRAHTQRLPPGASLASGVARVVAVRKESVPVSRTQSMKITGYTGPSDRLHQINEPGHPAVGA